MKSNIGTIAFPIPQVASPIEAHYLAHQSGLPEVIARAWEYALMNRKRHVYMLDGKYRSVRVIFPT